MTDPKARENFLKFGNPDGRGSMAVSIALPNFLQQKEYQLQVLIIFFILIIFVVPYWFLSQIQANQKDIGGIEIENRRLFTPLINENMIGKNIPVILAHSSELSKMRVPKEEFAVLDRLKRLDDIKEVIPKTKQGEPPKVNAKPVILLMAYMHSHLTPKDYEIEGISEAMEQIIRNVPNYMEVMLGETMKLAHMFKMGQSPKRITAKNIMTLIQFSQNFMQGGWIHKDPFQQLPGFDQVSAGKMKNRLNKNLYQYCTMDKQEKIEHFKAIMGEEPDLNQMVEQQEKCIDALPLVKLTMTAEVEGEDEIVVGDILTCKLRAEFRDMPKG